MAAIKPHRVRHEFVPKSGTGISRDHKRYPWSILVNEKLPSGVLTSGMVVPPDATVEELGDQSVVAASKARGTKDQTTCAPADLAIIMAVVARYEEGVHPREHLAFVYLQAC